MNNSTSPIKTIEQAWKSYYQSIEEMRLLMTSSQQFQDNPEQRGKAYHVLMELQAMGYTFAIAQPLAEPVIQHGWATDIFQAGQNSPDFVYGIVFLDGRYSYRLHGHVGDTSMLLLQTLDGFLGADVNVTGNFDLKNISTDGRFDILLSAKGDDDDHHIALNANSNYQCLLFRRALQDWHGNPGEVIIDRINDTAEYTVDFDPFSEGEMVQRIQHAERFMRFMVNIGIFGQHTHILQRANNKKNEMGMQSVEYAEDTGGMSSPDANYGMCIFELDEDEALLIEMENVPKSAFWSFSLSDIWLRTLDYTHRHTSLNDGQSIIDTDGTFRAILSHQDPGVANWLDTCGYKTGAIYFRNYLATQKIKPMLKKIKYDDIKKMLPETTKSISIEQRKKNIDYRRLGQLKMYGHVSRNANI